jgi:hypothetical protein
MQQFIFKTRIKDIQTKTKTLKKRLALFYLVSTKNSTIASFVDYATKQVLSACHIGHVLSSKRMDRVHRRSIEAHKIYGAELRFVLDRYFFKEKYRILRRARRLRPRLLEGNKILDYSFKFLVYFKGPSRYRRVVIKEFTKGFIRERLNKTDAEVWNQYYVVFFSDVTSIPHNGCRARKVKRTRAKRKPRIFRKSNRNLLKTL